MAENNGENLDLAKILATLASLPKPEQPPYETEQHTQDSTHSFSGAVGAVKYFQNEQPVHNAPAKDPRLEHRPASQHRQPAPRPQDKPSSSIIDPSTITDWKSGLRCVSKISAQNPDFVASVRKLMKDQERNVKDWEAGRARLLDDQKIKRDNEQTHRAALSLPGLLAGTAPLRTPERDQEELKQYDLKVYRACKQMVELQASALKALGIPFFGVKPFLVLADGSSEPSVDQVGESKSAGHTGGKITKTQLLELQRKMLSHLMDLYGD